MVMGINKTYLIIYTHIKSLYVIHYYMSIISQFLKKEKRVFLFFFVVFFLITAFYLFIYLFMAVLGLRVCARAFSSCGKWGPLFIAVRGPLTIAASPFAEHRLQARRLSNCGSRA